MKKYLLGILAVVVAVGTFAFTKPPKNEKKFTDFIFQFDLANFPATQPNVQDPANWLLVSDTSGCTPLLQQKACKIRVAESDTEGTPRHLKSTADIDASQFGATGVYFVSGGASVLQAVNRKN